MIRAEAAQELQDLRKKLAAREAETKAARARLTAEQTKQRAAAEQVESTNALLRAMKIRHRDKVTKLDNCEKKLGRQDVDLILLKEERNNYKAASESNKAESDSYEAMV
jgi:chromosome segregation ATPase